MKKEELVIPKEIWKNSYMSIARHYGGMKVKGRPYSIVNKDGVTVAELSDPNNEHFNWDSKYAIEPGETQDLVFDELIPFYKKFGREKLLRLLDEGKTIEDLTRLC